MLNEIGRQDSRQAKLWHDSESRLGPELMRSLIRLFTAPEKRAMLGLVRGMSGQLQLATASALLRSGVFAQLDQARTLQSIATATQTTEVDILRHLLDLGVRRRLLRNRSGAYSAKSPLARALAKDPEGPIASMLHEATTFHCEVFAALPARMHGQDAQPFLDEYGALIAQSSRISAHWICGFSQDLLADDSPQRILELGCGSGEYLRFYASIHPQHSGVGMDFDAKIVADANALMNVHGLADRFPVQQGDMRLAEDWPKESFDLITTHQSSYYFDAEQRAAIWKHARAHLQLGGRLAMVTPTSGGPMSDYFSLILLSTASCYALPSVEELTCEVLAAGFKIRRQERLIPGDAVWGIEAEAI